MTIPVPRTDAEAAAAAHARRWFVLAVLGIAQLMVVLDATIMNVALPSAQQALGFSDTNRQWVVTAYALSFGSLLLLGGRLSDLLGRRTTFLVGTAGFAVASAVGGAAGNFGVLVGARAAQGVFGALLAPAALSLLATTFTDPRERAKAFAIFGALAGTGGAIGLLLGGALTSYVSWRWALYVNVFFAAAAFAGAAALLPRQARAPRGGLDVKGTLAASTGLFSLVYGLAHAETAGWSDPATLGFLGASAALLALFGWLQTTVERPLLPPRVLMDRNRAGSYLAVLTVGSGMFAVFLFLTFYLQATMGYSAMRTGSAFMPMVAAIVVCSQLANIVLLPRLGARLLVPLGLGIGALGMTDFTYLSVEGHYATEVLPGLIVLGMGLGLIFAPAMQGAVSGVAARDSGVASSMVHTMQQVGGSIGIALLSTVAANAAESRLAGAAPTPELIAEATVHSYTTAFWWAAAIFAVGAVVVGALLKPGVPTQYATSDPHAAPALAR